MRERYLLASNPPGADSGGVYAACFNIDGTAASANKNWKFELYLDITPQDNIVTERNSTNTLASMSTSGNIAITAGQRLWIAGKNITDTTDYTIKNMNLNIHRI